MAEPAANEHGVRRQAGAREIAITPEMVEAGEFALSCCGSEELALAPLEATSRYAIEVFEAMARAGGYRTIVVRSRRRILMGNRGIPMSRGAR